MAGFGERRSVRIWITGLIAVVLSAVLWAGGPGAEKASARAHSSVVGGSLTTVEKWPWQVAFLNSKTRKPNAKPSKRFICGGSLIAPTIVVTATHCAMEIDLTKPEYFSVIGGRTNLNKASEGREVLVKDAVFPVTRSGVPRYVLFFDARWDVAVLELAEPLDQPTIKLAGPGEEALLAAGQPAVKTGWGVHRKGAEGDLSLILRQMKTAIQPPKACSYAQDNAFLGMPFDPDSQLCLSDPRSKATACYGDSGGPAVVRSSDGYRLIGATSYGTSMDCDGDELSVDAAVARPDTRAWIAGIAMERAGVDVIGSGGTTDAPPAYCTVPKVERMRLPQARAALRKGGCRAGKVRRTVIGHGKRLKKLHGTVLGTSRDYPFVLRERGHKVDMVVAKWTRVHRPDE
jgi:hypothetical protein